MQTPSPLILTFVGATSVVAFSQSAKSKAARTFLDDKEAVATTATDAVAASTDTVKYSDVIAKATDVNDVRRRRQLIKYVEEYVANYEAKNLRDIGNFLCDGDTILLKGKAPSTTANGSLSYEARTRRDAFYKDQFLRHLRTSFAHDKDANFNIENLKVERNSARPDFYGLRFQQKYASATFTSEDYVFLLIDFTNASSPQVQICKLQPCSQTKPEDVYTIYDFNY